MAWGAYVVVLGMLAILYFLAVFFFFPALIERRLENRQNDYAKRQLEKDVEEVDLKIKSGNAMADAILNSKMSLAGTKDIRLDVTAKIPEKLPVSDTEFSVIFGNLMDNAIEACQACEVPRLVIGIIKLWDGVIVIIKNTYVKQNMDYSRLGSIGISSKGERRGIGLYNVKLILSQYQNVMMNTEYAEQQFIQEIIIYDKLPESEE